MGVWIEIAMRHIVQSGILVTPCVGVWIEIPTSSGLSKMFPVTPCVGVWIEIGYGWEYY